MCWLLSGRFCKVFSGVRSGALLWKAGIAHIVAIATGKKFHLAKESWGKRRPWSGKVRIEDSVCADAAKGPGMKLPDRERFKERRIAAGYNLHL